MDFLKNNSLPFGLLFGLVFPVMCFGVVAMLFEFATDAGMMDAVADPMAGKRLRTLTIIALCSNAILIQIYNGRYTQQTLRGILIVTFFAAAVWFYMFHEDLLADF